MAEVPAAGQTLDILRYLSTQAAPVPAAAVARELALPRSTVYHLLSTLASRGFVVHLPEEQRWGLGVAAYELGTGYTRQAPLERLARSPLAELVDRTGQSAHLTVMHGREVVYVIEERARGRAPLVSDVDVRLPAHLTASGRAMLAALPRAQLLALFPDSTAFVSRTGRGPSSMAALNRTLGAVRREGYAVEDGEITEHFASVAVAILDHTSHPVASIAVTFEAASISATETRAIVRAATAAADVVQRRLRGRDAVASRPAQSMERPAQSMERPAQQMERPAQ